MSFTLRVTAETEQTSSLLSGSCSLVTDLSQRCGSRKEASGVCDTKWDEITRCGCLDNGIRDPGSRELPSTEPVALNSEQRRRVQAWRWAPAWVREREGRPDGWSSEKGVEGHRRAAKGPGPDPMGLGG